MKKVVLIGLAVEAVDFSRHPGLTAEKLLALLDADKAKLTDAGYDASIYHVTDDPDALKVLAEHISAEQHDIVLIGAGVRRNEENFLLFEKLINLVHENAPQARMCFNSRPDDSFDAVKRWS